MNLRQVEIFSAVMRSRTTVAAAFELGISQPAVSAAIKHMEAHTGLKLFERLGNRLVPTHEAKTLYRDTAPLQSMSQALAAKVRDLRHSRRGHLRVLSTQALADAIGSRALAGFLAGRPEVQVYFEVERTETIIEQIESGLADLGLSIAPPPRPGIQMVRVACGEMIVALPQGHRLARRVVLTADDLRNESLIGIESAARLGGFVRNAFESMGVEYRPAIEVRHGATACLLVRRGLGLSVIDPFSAGPDEEAGIVTRPFLPRIDVEACVMHLAGTPPSRLAAQFLAKLRDVEESRSERATQDGSPAHGLPLPQPSGRLARRP